MNNKGFTLVELLAAIVILVILVVVASTSVVSSVKRANDNLDKVVLKNLEDAAMAYGAEIFIPDKCAITSVATSTSVTLPSGCTRNLVTVQNLIDQQFFIDNEGACKNSLTKSILIYKYYDSSYKYYDTKVFIPDGVCVK